MGSRVSGKVEDSNGNALQTTVRMFDWSDGSLLDEVTSSSSDGSYVAETVKDISEVLVTAKMGSSSRPLSHGPITPESVSLQLLYDFDDGTLQGWTDDTGNNLLSATTTRSISGSYALEGQKDSQPENIAHISPSDLSGGVQIPEYSFWYYETSSSSGAFLAVEDTNGDIVVAAGTNNPQFSVFDSGGETNLARGNYGQWYFCKITFDWGNGEYTVVFEDINGNQQASATRTLNKSTNVETLRIKNTLGSPGTGFESGPYYHWFDDIVVKLA